MDRQFLKKFDLDDDTIGKIIDEHHSNVNSVKEQLSDKKQEVKDLKSERDDLKEKARQAEDNEDTINSLRSKYDEAKKTIEDYKSKVENNDLDKQIIKNVTDAYDVDDVLNYLDRSKFEYDDNGKISNFDDVMKEVRESKPHYFNSTQNNNGDPNNQQGNDPNNQQGNDPQGTKQGGVNYATGKGQGAGNPGGTDYEAIGNKWAEILGGK